MAKLGNPNIHYAIAGVGDKKEYLEELAQTLGVSDRLHLLGYRRDIPELNTAADAFCFPSHREGLGLAAIEAMACGLPIITSNVHGINDYSIDGVTGYKCSPTDAEGFASAIEKLLKNRDLIEKTNLSNKEYIKKYSINEIVPKVKFIYQS